MGDLFQNASDEANPGDEVRPSIEAIVAAFRKTAGGQAVQEKSGGAAPTSPAIEPPSTPTKSPAEMVVETITAFRKAERRVAKRSEESRARDSGGDASEAPKEGRSPGTEAPRSRRRNGTEGDEESSGEESDGPVEAEEPQKQTDEKETDSPDDLALAFRRALSKRERASAEESPTGKEPRESERSEERSSEAEGRSTTGEDAPLVDASTTPTRPDPSFLWVTDSSGDASGTASVEELSEPRPREADAFLLRGGGERPYQLLRRIRSHPEPSVYLKPVFWRRAPGQQSPVADHVDGEWTPDADEETLGVLRERAATINRRMSALSETESAEGRDVELRVLRFVATRSAEFAPRRAAEGGDEESIVYPKLTPLLGQLSQNGDQCGDELAEILSATARRIREKRSTRG